MPPRECDNDECDYETYVNSEGQSRAKWDHVDGCEGSVPFGDLIVKNPRTGSFQSFMMGLE